MRTLISARLPANSTCVNQFQSNWKPSAEPNALIVTEYMHLHICVTVTGDKSSASCRFAPV